MAIGITVTLIPANSTRLQLEDEAANRFGFATDQVVLRIEERLLSYALLLRGAAGLFHTSEEVTREDWKFYVDSLHLEENLTGIQGIGFSRLIAAADLPSHQDTVRSSGFPDYAVYPAGQRDVYTSIIYLEPFEGRNLVAFGYDMFSETVRRQAMERARDNNDASLSGRVELVQETGTDVQAGTLIYVPVYDTNAATSTPEERRAALVGWAYSPFRMTDLMTGVIGDWSRVNMNSLGLRIYDGTTATPANLMYVSSGLTSAADHHRGHIDRVLDVHGRQWLLEFEQLGDTPDIDYAPVRRALVAGILLSILLFALLMSQSRVRLRAEAIAHKLTDDIRHIAHYDLLTGLPNRLLLSDRLSQIMARANRRETSMAVVYLDLDGFKAVNDTHGHEAGDNLLRTVAERMLDAVREDDTVARIGGDEFVIILHEITHVENLKPVLRRLINACSAPITIGEHTVNVCASMGVRIFNSAEQGDNGSELSEDRLIREADRAMYQAKTSGKGRAFLFVSDGPAVCIVEQH